MPPVRKETLCLFCSVCCEVAAEIHDNGIVLPDYVNRGREEREAGRASNENCDGRICGRGHLVAELLSHPQRLNAAQIKKGAKKKLLPAADAISATVERLKGICSSASASSVAVIVDGNLPCEDILAASEFARKRLKTEHIAVHLPPSDKALLDGIAAVEACFLTRESLGACDTVIVLGDAFAAHPLVAKTILDAKNARRGNRLVVIDSFLNTTARFASDFVRHLPGAEHIVLMGLAKALHVNAEGLTSHLGDIALDDVAKMTGVDSSTINSVASAVVKARRVGVVVSSEIGRNDSLELVGALACLISRCGKTRAGAQGGEAPSTPGDFGSRETDAGVLPLLSYGNAMGAYTVASNLGFSSLPAILGLAKEGKITGMVVIGTDLVSALPQSIVEESLSDLDLLISCSALPNATMGRADVVLPSALWFEEDGVVMDMSAVPKAIHPLAAPPSGAMTVREILNALGTGLGGEEVDAELSEGLLVFKNGGDLSATVETCLPIRAAEPPGPEEYLLVPAARSINFADGSLTRSLQWPSMMAPTPILRMNIHDAGARHISNGDEVKVSSKNGELLARVSLKDSPPSGVLALSSQFSESRNLFDWKLDADRDRISVGVARVRLSRAG